MALLPQIVDISEVETYLGIGDTITEKDRGLLEWCRQMTEYLVRDFCGHGITQATYTDEFYPVDDLTPDVRRKLMEYRGGQVVTIPEGTARADSIYLRNIFTKSITTVHEDTAAYAGQGPSDFAAASLLTAGTHYYLVLDNDASTISKSGELRRIGTGWSTRPGTIKITYVAGLTATELDEEYLALKFAVIDEIIVKYKTAKNRSGTGIGGLGVVSQFSIKNAMSVTYETQSLRGIFNSGISAPNRERFTPYIRLSI
jgi:hypothetical protein